MILVYCNDCGFIKNTTQGNDYEKEYADMILGFLGAPLPHETEFLAKASERKIHNQVESNNKKRGD